jgi:hypothetical protein
MLRLVAAENRDGNIPRGVSKTGLVRRFAYRAVGE